MTSIIGHTLYQIVIPFKPNKLIETAEKEVQDTSCRGFGGVPPALKKSPEIGGYRGLIESVSAVSYKWYNDIFTLSTLTIA
jgi:hypothetical protein